MKLLSILLIAATGVAMAQQYDATPLTSATTPVHFVNVIGVNSKGLVLGDACVNGTGCAGLDRFPALWSNGVITPLPIPAGYIYVANLHNYNINDSGTVVGAVQKIGAGNNVNDVVLWENGNSTIIVPPQNLFHGCPGVPASGAFALNSAGHVLISTAYFADPSFNGFPGSCNAFWIYPLNSIVPFPTPPQCGSQSVTYSSNPPVVMNNADQVVFNVENFHCPAIPATFDLAVVQASGSFSYLPVSGPSFGVFDGASAAGINDLGSVQGGAAASDPPFAGAVIWDGSGVHLLGPGLSGNASLNNVGEVVYFAGSPAVNGQIFEWQNGVSVPIQLPSGFSGPKNVLPGSLNDAGQFTVTDLFFGGRYLLTPSGPCGQDITSQTQVTRGGFRYNHNTVRFSQAVTVTNSSGSSIAGPVSLVTDNLPAKATLFGISGATQCLNPAGSQYINVASSSLDSGGSVTTALQFINTEMSGVSYLPRVITGPSRR